MADTHLLHKVCPSCKGIELPETVTCTACGGSGCAVCGWGGLVPNEVCGVCLGALKVPFGELNSDLIDLLNDMKQNIDEIKVRVNEL